MTETKGWVGEILYRLLGEESSNTETLSNETNETLKVQITLSSTSRFSIFIVNSLHAG